jgi:hypothetical protein
MKIRASTFAIIHLAIASSCLGGCASASDGAPVPSKEFVVSCASGVAHDASGCQPVANQRCKGKARFFGVLSSTAIPANKIHMITARYSCASG